MDRIITIIVAFITIGLVYYIMTYNKLTKAKNSVLEAKSGIDIALLKRFDLITDLVEVTKGYSKYEENVLTKLVQLRNQVENNPEFANDGLNGIIKNLNMTIEAYPDLQASAQYLNLQKILTNVEEHLQAARRLYNSNVTAYNNSCEQFPSSLVASNHKFERLSLFETEITNLVKPIVKY